MPRCHGDRFKTEPPGPYLKGRNPKTNNGDNVSYTTRYEEEFLEFHLSPDFKLPPGETVAVAAAMLISIITTLYTYEKCYKCIAYCTTLDCFIEKAELIICESK